MKKTNRRGQGMVEMAILFPLILLVIVGGVIDFGFAFFNMITLQQLATDAAQYAAEGFGKTGSATSDFSRVQLYVNQKTPGWWGAGAVTVQSVTSRALQTDATGLVTCRQVTLSYVSKTYTPFYQASTQLMSGNPGIPLKTDATFQVPVNLNQ